MVRPTLAVAVAVALGAASLTLSGPAFSQESPSDARRFYLHWDTGCGGDIGTLDLDDRPSDDPCANFFPGISPGPLVFPAEAGLPFVLDASRKIGIRWVHRSVLTAAAHFDVSLTGTVDGQPELIAEGSKDIFLSTVPERMTVVELSLDADPALDGGEVTDLTLTIGQRDGFSYSSINFETEVHWVEVGTGSGPEPTPSPTPSPTPTPTPAPLPDPEPAAVLAFVDTGINPYHDAFRDTSPLAYQHPSTYIPGYPADAEPLNLTLDAETYRAAVKADCESVWSKVEPRKLYWIPGTKIVGAISFELPLASKCASGNPDDTYVLDNHFHGTMVASRGAAALDYGACRECKIVMVEAPAYVQNADPDSTLQPNIDAISWAGNNAGWIDAQSNSWFPYAPLWDPSAQAGLYAAPPQLVRAVEEVSSKHLAFWAAGNGAAFRWGVVGHPTITAPHVTPSAIVVGGHDSGYVATWPGFTPHVISDACFSWAAVHNDLSASDDELGTGTSAATPFAAGGATQILLDAREILGDLETGVDDGIVARGTPNLVSSGPLADGIFTKEEWRRLVFVTATPRPEAQYEDGPPCSLTGFYDPTPVQWKDVPAGYPEYVQIGYGAVDRPSIALAGKVLRGEVPAPDRSATDDYFAVDHTVRSTTYEVWSRP